jgi:hypothetical protein
VGGGGGGRQLHRQAAGPGGQHLYAAGQNSHLWIRIRIQLCHLRMNINFVAVVLFGPIPRIVASSFQQPVYLSYLSFRLSTLCIVSIVVDLNPDPGGQ